MNSSFQVDDMAIRERSVQALNLVIQCVQKDPKQLFQQVVVENVLPEVKGHLRDDNEVSRALAMLCLHLTAPPKSPLT